jgi:hypothetical protein
MRAFVSDSDTTDTEDEDELYDGGDREWMASAALMGQRVGELASSIANRRRLHNAPTKRKGVSEVSLPGRPLGAKHTVPSVLRPPHGAEWPAPVVSLYPPHKVGFDEAARKRHNEIANSVLKHPGSATGRTQGTSDTVQLHWGASSAQQAIGHSKFRQLVLHGDMVDESDLENLSVRCASSNSDATTVPNPSDGQRMVHNPFRSGQPLVHNPCWVCIGEGVACPQFGSTWQW